MVDRFIDACVSFMTRRGAFEDTPDQREIYAYGMELQVYYILHAVLLLGIALVFGRGLETALLLFFFGMVQSNGGGYHAETHLKCFLIMATGVLAFIGLLPLFHDHIILQIVSIVFGLAVVLAFAPVSHKNHPLSPEKSVKLGKRAKIQAVVLCLVWLLLSAIKKWTPVSDVVSITMLFTGLSILGAFLKKRIAP
jgi:accessory gene regulator B